MSSWAPDSTGMRSAIATMATMHLLCFTIGCTPPSIAGGEIETPTPETSFPGVQCSAVRPQTEPDLMAWDPGSRANLARLRKEGAVAIRYEHQGCDVELELLSNCIGPAASYRYNAYAETRSKTARNAAELFLELPVGAAKLAGKLEGSRALRTDYMLVGTAALPAGSTYRRAELKGAGCERATHVVSVVYLGGFAMVAGDVRKLGASASVFQAGLGGSTGGEVDRLDRAGDPAACKEAEQSGKENPGCSVPLRIGLLPLDQSACPPGETWNGALCAPSRAAPEPTVAPQGPEPVNERLKLATPVLFEDGTDKLRPESEATLSFVNGYLAANPMVTLLRIEGHTDNRRSAEENDVLSRRRARAVASWFISHGVDCHRLVAVGFGQSRPVAPNITAADRAKNERAELVIAGWKGKGTDGVPRDGGGQTAGQLCGATP